MNDTSPRQSRKEESPLPPTTFNGWARRRRHPLVCLFTLIGLVGCDQGTPPPADEHLPADGAVIVFIGPRAPAGQWEAMCGGARKAAHIYPMVRLETIPSLPGELELAAARAAEFAPAAVCMYAPPGEDADAAVRTITAHGAYVVTIGMGQRPELAFGHVRVDWTGAAEKLGRNIEKIAAGKKSCLLLHWSGRAASDADCRARFEQRARHHAAVTIIDERDASEGSPVEVVRQMMALFPHAGLIVTLDPLPWLSSRPEELLGKNANFATIGTPPELWPALRRGAATALCGPFDGEVGRQAVEIALGALTESADPGQARTVDCELVTRDLLDSFAERYAEAAGMQVGQFQNPPTTTAPASVAPADSP